jgi:hypothetical protein
MGPLGENEEWAKLHQRDAGRSLVSLKGDAMTVKVRWTMYLKAKNVPKCEKLINRFQDGTGISLSSIQSEKYWKDEEMYRVVADSSIESDDPAGITLTLLDACGRVAHGCYVGRPMYDGGSFEFQGDIRSDAITIPGIQSITFEARSAGPSETFKECLDESTPQPVGAVLMK